MSNAAQLIGTTNGSFQIITQGETAVIAQKVSNPEEFVAWSYHIEDGKPHYYWGRYGSKETAQTAFSKKERGEYSGS